MVVTLLPTEGAITISDKVRTKVTVSEEMYPSTSTDTFKWSRLNADGSQTVILATVNYNLITETAILDPEVDLEDPAANSLDSGTWSPCAKIWMFAAGRQKHRPTLRRRHRRTSRPTESGLIASWNSARIKTTKRSIDPLVMRLHG
jgi:hypothetical protein